MKGHPLLEVIFFLLLSILTFIPLYRLTSPKIETAKRNREISSPIVRTSCWITFQYAHRPQKIMLTQGSQKLWEANKITSKKIEHEIFPATDPDAYPLKLLVIWPENIPKTALEIILEPEGKEEQKQTVWGKQKLETELDFTWNG